MAALGIVDSAPAAYRPQLFAQVREVLAHGFALASARHQQFLGALSVSSSTPSSLIVPADALFERLKSIEKLLVAGVFERAGRLSAAPAPAAPASMLRSRSAASAPASGSPLARPKKQKTSRVAGPLSRVLSRWLGVRC